MQSQEGRDGNQGGKGFHAMPTNNFATYLMGNERENQEIDIFRNPTMVVKQPNLQQF